MQEAGLALRGEVRFRCGSYGVLVGRAFYWAQEAHRALVEQGVPTGLFLLGHRPPPGLTDGDSLCMIYAANGNHFGLGAASERAQQVKVHQSIKSIGLMAHEVGCVAYIFWASA